MSPWLRNAIHQRACHNKVINTHVVIVSFYQTYRRLRRIVKNNLTYGLMGLFHVLFPRQFRFDPVAPRILLLATTALGDSIWLTPLLTAIKKRYPKAYVGVVCGPLGAPVFQERNDVDALFVLPKPQSGLALKIIPALRRKQFQAVIVSHVSQRIVMPVAFMTGASKRIAGPNCCKGLDRLMTDIDTQSFAWIHAVESKFILGKHLDVPRPEQPLLNLQLSREEHAAAQQYLYNHADENKLLVGMVPGASRKNRQWQPEKWIALGRWLVAQYDVQILVIGSPAEYALCESIASDIPGAVNSAGALPLRHVMALIDRSALLVSNDTGPLHIASACMVPVLALFGLNKIQVVAPYNPSLKMMIMPDEAKVTDGLGVHEITVTQAKDALQTHWPEIIADADARTTK